MSVSISKISLQTRLLILAAFALIALLIAVLSAYRTAQTSAFLAERQAAASVNSVVRQMERGTNDLANEKFGKGRKVPPHIREISEKYADPAVRETAIALRGAEDVSAAFCDSSGNPQGAVFNQNFTAEETNFINRLCSQSIENKTLRQEFESSTVFAATAVFDSENDIVKGAFAVRSLPKTNLLADRFNFLTQMFLLFSVIGSVVFAFFTLRDFRRGMRKIETGLQTMPNDLSTRIDEPKITELNEISREINRLAENLEINLRRQKMLEKDLAQSEKLTALGRVASGAAHEIRNPLAAMKLKIQLAERGKFDGARLEKTFAVLNEEIARLDNIVAKMLDTGNSQKLNLKQVAPSDILRKRLEIFGEKAALQNVEIKTEFAGGEEIFVEADAEKLTQVFDNLLLNALEAMPAGGVLRASETIAEGEIIYEFSDTGAGISADEKAKIFEPFFTTKDRGTGLGLAISREIAEAHGGKLFAAESANGAKFILTLRRKNIL